VLDRLMIVSYAKVPAIILPQYYHPGFLGATASRFERFWPGTRSAHPMGQLGVIVGQESKHPVPEPIATGTTKTFHKCRFVISRTGHFRDVDLFAEG